ncbi:LysE family translocator [Vibrio ostreicida]|uniref:LysE family translocator n=1 Tax=Vibrio ostreicida TaxID=526588 RepID=A0ABT8C278_9VIBR|nr:LysE family translocator [Vibrio ostreicida]MDN3612443.1 LysE family translocator [Vibrio ostreicida]NPD10156.1 LysE family translocator [Vibrio ostreicida]
MTFESAMTFFIAMLVFSITPGPGVFAIIARAMVSGMRSCIWLSAGMVVSDVIYLLLACLGLAAIAENWATLFLVIRYVGAAYLVYLGYKMIKTLPEAQAALREDSNTLEGSHLSGFVQGFLISASNPKVILFYISFLPTFMDLTVLSHQDIGVAACLSIVALMTGLMLIALGARRLVKVLKTPKAQRHLNTGAGSVMIMAGAYLAVTK